MNLKRITAFIMVLVMSVSAAIIPSQAAENNSDMPESLKAFETRVDEEGSPTYTTAQFFDTISVVSNAVEILTGKALIPNEDIQLSFDDLMSTYCNNILEGSGLDIPKLLSAFNGMNYPFEQITTIAKIDTGALRDFLIERGLEFKDAGQMFPYYVCYMLGVYVGVVKKCEVKAVPTDEPDVIEVVLFITYKDGTTGEMHPSIWINTETGDCYNQNGMGMINTGFNSNVKTLVVYATINAWMRNFGFTFLYDLNCYIMPMWNYNTRRIHFNYDDRQWMIQIWKGNYLIANGGEVGVYNRNKYAIGTFYNCATDDELMMMSLKVSKGDEVIVDLEPQLHWWVNSFKMSNRLYSPKSLTLESTIQFPNEEMMKAFTSSIDWKIYKDITYTVDGNNVSIVW